MKTSVQARLDEETRAELDKLVRLRGMTTSDVVREGIHLLARRSEADAPIKIAGLGKYDSGLTDLGSNKKHLANYGRSAVIGSRPGRKSTVR
jgi:predicted transcriptional regulator